LFGLSGFEVAIILIFGFLIFGPDKLPQIARTVGRVIRQFRTAQEQMNKVIKSEVYDPLKDLEPLANPFAGFSLDLDGFGLKDNAKDTKKVAVKSTGLPGDKGATDEGADKDAEATDDKAKTLSREEVDRALAEDAEKAKRKAIRDAAKKSTGGADSESFADRRARLEKEHAQAKVKAEKAAQDTPGVGSEETSKAPATAKTAAKPKAAADAKPKAATAAKSTKVGTSVPADTRGEDGKGN